MSLRVRYFFTSIQAISCNKIGSPLDAVAVCSNSGGVSELYKDGTAVCWAKAISTKQLAAIIVISVFMVLLLFGEAELVLV